MLDEQVAREFAERYLEAWNSHDAERIEPLVTGDVVWLDPTLPEPARGVREVKDFMRAAWRRRQRRSGRRPRAPLRRARRRAPERWRARRRAQLHACAVT